MDLTTSTYEDGERYLVIEPSVKCTDPEYHNNLGLVIILSIVVSVGFPAAYSLLLFIDKRKINPRIQGMFDKGNRIQGSHTSAKK